jgi:seryl-tRNA synthetase
MGLQTPNTTKLDELLKPHLQEFDVLREALKEVTKEESDKKKDAAKELIRKALDLKGRMEQADRLFNSEKKKFEKELGKTLNRLRNMAAGKPLDEGEDEGKEKGDAPSE